MQKVFGIPATGLAVALTILLVIAAVGVGILAARHRVFMSMAMRNVRRRRGRSVLIMTGLMLGTTIIASALLTGDTMGRTVRSAILHSLGSTDVDVVATGAHADLAGGVEITPARSYFDAQQTSDAVRRAIGDSPLVDGIAPAIIEPVAAQDPTTRQSEPRIMLFAADPDALQAFGLAQTADVDPGSVVLNTDAAEELRSGVGARVILLAGQRQVALTVDAIVDAPGTGADASGAIVALPTAQQLVGQAGKVNHVLVSNRGDETSGADYTSAVQSALRPALASLGLSAEPVKRDGIDLAEEQGNTFMQLFTTFGSFSIAAGILLIFLIFVMLAAERRSEMGMARAIGTRRGHLVQIFLYEGATYDILAAALGAALGIGVSFVIVQVTANAFSTSDINLDIDFGIDSRSLAIAYALGVLLTFGVVILSAWRVSRLNIVSAIRDTPEPLTHERRRNRRGLFAAELLVGSLLAYAGISGDSALPWLVGVSLLIMAMVPLALLLGRSERIAYTAAGLALVVWWLLPLDLLEPVLGKMKMDFGVWTAGGLLIVIGATWVVTYNADLLLAGMSRLAWLAGSVAPSMRMAMAYPLRNRFRTGVTFAMFTLVVFTLISGMTIPTAFVRALDDVGRYGGGADVRATAAPTLAIPDLRAALPPALSKQAESIGSQSYVPVQARQDGATGGFERYPLRGLDAEFLNTTTYGMASIANGYGSAREVWQAMRTQPDLAVVDAYVVPRRENWGAGVLPDFQLEGLYIEDATFDPVPVTVRDPQTGRQLHVTIIGVLRDSLPYEMAGISVSQDFLAPFGDRAVPNVYHVTTASGVDPAAFAVELESALLANGMEAETYQALLDDVVGASVVFIRLVMGFMMLGLLVGVAALGVISARAVVERRQHIGVLRAIGFQPAAVRRIMLIEATFISLTSVVVGTVLGLAMAYNVIADASSQANYSNLTFAVPWTVVLAVFATVCVAAVVTTIVPALRASRVYPAEALRYQ